MNFSLKELLDIPKLNNLLNSLEEFHGMPSAILDKEGNILTATAWQDICTKFHRVNRDTEKLCIESDLHIDARLGEKTPHVVYRCPMGLVDAAAPIIIEGVHLGNVFTGQLFMEAPDDEFFINQAHKYGFDETEYLHALRKVPLFSEEKLHNNLSFIHNLTQMLAEQGLQRLQQLEAEKALRSSEEKHRTILQTAMDGFWLVNMEGKILEVNDAYCHIIGYSKQELLSMNIADLEAKESTEEIAVTIQKIKLAEKVRFETQQRRKDGTVIDVEVSALYRPVDGESLATFLRDITERKHVETTLLESQTNLSTTLDATADGILAVDGAGKIQFFNRRFSELWNIPKNILDTGDDNTLLGHVLMQLLEPELFLKEVARLYNLNESSFDTVQFKDGRIFERYSFPQQQKNTQKLGRVWSFRDVTKNKRSEAAIINSHKLLQTIINTAPMRIYWKDTNLRYLGANSSFVSDAGLACPEDLIGKDDFQLAWNEQAELYQASDKSVIESAIPKIFYDELQTTPNGNSIWIRTSKVPLCNEADEVIGVLGIHEDISERKQNEFELLKLSRAVQQSPVSIMITDTGGSIEFVNQKFTELTDYTAEEAIGLNVIELDSGLTPPESIADMWATIVKGETWEGDFHNKTKDGRLFWEHAVISGLRNEKGTISHYIAVKEDITEKKIIIQQLNEAKEKAEAATLAKSSFLSTMSHEIRTPMNGVIGMTNLLLDSGLTAEQMGYAEIIHKSGENLLDLINDILDFSKIEAGKLDIELLDFDLRTMLEDTAEILALRAADKGLELICRIDPVVPSYLKGDPGRVRQILTNLIGNAIKFTHEGEVVISTSLASDQGKFATVLFEVRDTGIGISPERLEAVFAPFTQADGSTTRKFGGTGLGLTICKQLAELMGGEIGVSSETGAGSTFWFTVRFEKQLEHNIPDIKSFETLHADITGTRILVVDDNSTNRKLLTILLGLWGCRFDEAADGETGLVLLNEAVSNNDPFHIVLLDQEMPGMDGLELARRIKADLKVASTAMIMITSIGQRGDAVTLEKIGFKGYLAKPVRQSQLHDCIFLVLGRKSSVLESQQLPQGIVTRYTVAEYAEQRVRILLAEDNIINQKVAQNILNKLGYKADVVANGLEAVRALELINYDLVLMDCQMPEMDGFEATKAIRIQSSKVHNHNVPIIAMTANAMKGDREECIEAGMNDYLAKPVKKDELAFVLDKWLLNDMTR